MLGIRRRARKTRAQLVRDELSESFDHFMTAATFAAGGVGATVGPRVNAAREFVTPAAGRVKDATSHGWESTAALLAPLAAAARDGARQASGTTRKAKSRNLKKTRGIQMSRTRKRWPMLAGLLAAGATVGAIGALVMRRRRQQQWDEYDPNRAIGSTADAGKGKFDRAMDATAAAADKAAQKVSSTATSIADKTSTVAGSMSDRTTSATESAKAGTSSMADSARHASDQTNQYLSNASGSRNSRT